MIPNVLSIAGTDPTGGAGLPADLKSISALGGYAMGVVTAVVAQNTRGVAAVSTVAADLVHAQLQAVSSDVRIDAVKIGMLSKAYVADAVTAWLDATRPPAVVLDPVMVATSGDRLWDAAADGALRRLCRRADVVTPNLPELAVLAGSACADTWPQALAQARAVSAQLHTLVLVKGGHLDARDCPDALVSAEGVMCEVRHPRLATDNTHGTGCSLSSALATLRACGSSWPDALSAATAWLHGALRHAGELEVGGGHGPVHHFWRAGGEAGAVRADAAAERPDAAPSERPRPAHPSGPGLVAAAGAFTTAVWERAGRLRARITADPFVHRLAEGSLDPRHFGYYLAQDARYLREYARVLAEASRTAPDEAAQRFWAEAAHRTVAVESELHRAWTRAHPEASDPAWAREPGPVTRAYTDHLLATASRDGYAAAVAAVLPCYWVYAEVGEMLAARRHLGHPYDAWLAMYGDPGFAAATQGAIALVEQAAAGASAHTRQRMADAFAQSVVYERAFFAQAPSPQA